MINDLVYCVVSLLEGSKGMVMLFFDDVCISINVCLFEGCWVFGIWVLVVVWFNVFDKGEIWFDSVFVVNDWYILVYELIFDSYGNWVGMFYVGFL